MSTTRCDGTAGTVRRVDCTRACTEKEEGETGWLGHVGGRKKGGWAGRRKGERGEGLDQAKRKKEKEGKLGRLR